MRDKQTKKKKEKKRQGGLRLACHVANGNP